MKTILFIGFGGFAGSVARYYVSKLNQLPFLHYLPFGTFAVNILGSFILGLLTGIADRGNILTHAWRLFLMVGFCGGFTTFSTFTNENLTMMRNGQIENLIVYTAVSVFTGFLSVYLGFQFSKAL
jgi:fluoride exporter